MKTFEEWWNEVAPNANGMEYARIAYEAGQANALPDLTEKEWEYLDDIQNSRTLPLAIVSGLNNKLITQALALRERHKK